MRQHDAVEIQPGTWQFQDSQPTTTSPTTWAVQQARAEHLLREAWRRQRWADYVASGRRDADSIE